MKKEKCMGWMCELCIVGMHIYVSITHYWSACVRNVPCMGILANGKVVNTWTHPYRRYYMWECAFYLKDLRERRISICNEIFDGRKQEQRGRGEETCVKVLWKYWNAYYYNALDSRFINRQAGFVFRWIFCILNRERACFSFSHCRCIWVISNSFHFEYLLYTQSYCVEESQIVLWREPSHTYTCILVCMLKQRFHISWNVNWIFEKGCTANSLIISS